MTRAALVVLLLGGLGGCRCDQPAPPAPRPDVRPYRALQLSPPAKLGMRRLEEAVGEVRRRMGRGATEGPAKVVRTLVGEIPDRPEADFRYWRSRLDHRAQVLAKGPQAAGEYGAVVEACLGCHQAFARASLPRIQALALTPAKTSQPRKK